MSFNIDNLQLVDDLDVSLDANDYVDPKPPAPIDAGNYGFRIKSMQLRKKRDSEELELQDGKYPIITIEMVEVVEPQENARPVALYQDFRTKPFERTDYSTGTKKMASALNDLIRSADATVSYNGLTEGLKTFEGLVASGAIFYARFDWTATDVEAAKEAVAEIETAATQAGQDLKSPEVRKAVNDVWKKFRTKGQSKFRNKAGVVVPFIDAADGSTIPARVEIPMDGFISQNELERVKLGPKQQRRQPVAA